MIFFANGKKIKTLNSPGNRGFLKSDQFKDA